MISVSQKESFVLLQKLPEFEMFYEIIQHKTFSAPLDSQTMTLHIPMGRKNLLWLTHHERNIGFVWVEINAHRKYGAVSWQKWANNTAPLPWFYGTLLYGTRTHNRFYIEDIYQFQGFSINKYTQVKKWAIIRMFLEQFGNNRGQVPRLMVPVMNSLCNPDYPIYSIQTRHLTKHQPYVHYRGVQTVIPIEVQQTAQRPVEKHMKKPQYNKPAIFRVMAELSSDLYKLYALGSGSSWIFYDFACIQTQVDSQAMNLIFRQIRENRNIDLIEESDDEADKPISQFTDCAKQVFMKCVFNHKWRKWTPVCQMPENTRATHISLL